jgi:fumarate hydratase subunit alpha
MREVNAKQITEVVKKLCIDANLYLGEDVLAAFDRGEKMEESPVGKEMFQQLKENARIAREEKVAMCQDTGLAVVFVELGQEVHIAGGGLQRSDQRRSQAGLSGGVPEKISLQLFQPGKHQGQYPSDHPSGDHSGG